MKTPLLIAGFIVFAAGWAIRSTVILHSYDNKPVGGIMITIGFLAMGWALYRILRRK